MKKKLLTSLLLIGSLFSQAQNEIIIDGQLTHVKDGLVIELLRFDGRVGTTIGTDTIENGKFHFKVKPEKDLDKLDLFVNSEEFPSMSRLLYAKPNARNQVIGTNNLIKTWAVKSNVKEQEEIDRYLYVAKDLWTECLQLQSEVNACWGVVNSSTTTSEEKQVAKEKIKNLQKQSGDIMLKIQEKEIALMKEMPITSVWLEMLYGLSNGVRYFPNFPFTAEVKALYARMSDEQKQSEMGQLITVNVFPAKVVQIGDDMADADLYDLDGKVHHLAELRGKFLLVDFWSSGCGPCIMALPEMGELQEKYAEKLTIVSLSSDTEKRWKAASVEHKMTWMNWSDKKQTGGLYAKYGVRGIPHYVLISPEGKVVDTWSGYGKGNLLLRLRPYMQPKPVMSAGEENSVLWVNYPDVQTNQSHGILEIKRVERTSDATTIYFKAYYIPKYWIRIAKETILLTPDKRQYKVLKADGITLGEQFWMPESGEAEFSVTFEPLPLDAKMFDFQEGEGEDSWRMQNIRLVK